MNREHSLQQELQQLRVLFEDERKRTEKLRSEIIFQEKKWENEKERHCFDYDKKIKDLHEEVFVLQKKLEIQNEEKRTLGDIKGKSVHVSIVFFVFFTQRNVNNLILMIIDLAS